MKSTWPDGTPKSRNNAFNWRGEGSAITRTYEFRASAASKRRAKVKPGLAFTIYTRAKASK